MLGNSRELTAPGGIANPRTFRELLAPGYSRDIGFDEQGNNSLLSPQDCF
jgi:hypothetical protein